MTNHRSRGSLGASAYSHGFPEVAAAADPLAAPARVPCDLSDEDIRALSPVLSTPVLMPDKLEKRTREFVKAFTGNVMYAVKCNPDEVFLDAIHRGGVARFDVASIAEVRLISRLFPDAKMFFMHPIKAPEAIYEAYNTYGVRAFVLDYADELDKILHVTNAAPDLELYVRVAIPKDNGGADVLTDFSSKFGAKPDYAAELLRLCRPVCARLGLSFHVGTQCHDPATYTKAVGWAAKVIADSGVAVEALDIGGGFPADLKGKDRIPPITAFTKAIAKAVKDNGLDRMELLCEIGRGLVACAGALIVRVEGRKGDLLYLNDGTYGGIFEGSGAFGLRYPVRLIRREERPSKGAKKPFRFAGPTCDSTDMLKGPFMLPGDVRTGDWIMIEQIGAYGEVSRTNFNGFCAGQKLIVRQEAGVEELARLS